MEKMTRKQYITKQRKKVAFLVSQVLVGKLSILEASRELSKLVYEIDVDERDEDFLIFIAIDSETEHLPIGEVRKMWSKEALWKKESEITNSEKWAREIGLKACRNLLSRFGEYLDNNE